MAPLTLTLAQLPLWATSILVVFYVLISVVMILAVLIQRPQGGGLSTAFGAGAGSGQTAFGTKIGDALTIFTVTVFALFLATSIVLVYFLRPSEAAAEQPVITAPEGTGTLPGDAGEAPAGITGDTPAEPTGDAPVDAPADQPAPSENPAPADVPATDPGAQPDAPVPTGEPTEPPAQPAGEPSTPPGR